MTPLVLLYAAYVVIHGHDSPGGGFQGGVLLAAAVILVKLVRGRPTGWEIGSRSALALACVGLSIYAWIGLVPLFFGGHYLDYGVPQWIGGPAAERVLGTLGIEIGVTFTVAGVILVVFDALAAWGEDESGGLA
jgi:multicomponent Na+:H+ antiporter subunit B